MPYRRASSRYSRSRSRSLPKYKRSLGAYTSSGASKDLDAIKNPFSKATLNAKIPDGKCSLSSGQRFQQVREYVNDDSGQMVFALFPGINTLVIPQGTTANANDGAETAHMVIGNHFKSTVVDGDEPNSVENIFHSDDIRSWRLVSQGMRISLVNNSDENDGWFESIQIPLEVDQIIGKWQLAQDTWRTDNNMPFASGTTSWVEHPSYKSGKLRHIHRHVFKNKSHTNDFDFVGLHRAIKNWYGLQNVNQTIIPSPLFDKNYMVTLVRIHGRPNGAVEEPANTPTRVMIHAVSNQEIVYDETSPLSRVQTRAYKRFYNTAAIQRAANAQPQAMATA